jgi:leucyl-tRNA synthetase
MDTFVDSSWYFLRYTSPDLEDAPFDAERASDWMPVDQYVGGIEHAVMHLLYARFFTKVLDDIDLLDGVREPFTNLTNQGMVLGEDGNKMSKSRGNGVSPQRIIDEYGADTARLFIMEAAQPEKEFAWSSEGVQSAHSFLQNVYGLVDEFAAGDIDFGNRDDIADYVTREIDATAAKATTEYERFRFNHALQAVRELVSLLRRYCEATDPEEATVERGLVTAAKLLAPVAPHVGEELWDTLGHDGLLAEADWPDAAAPEDYDTERRLVENTREDVRDIVDTVGIEDPETITLAVAPAWKHDVVDIAREADNVVPAVMQNEDLQQYGEAAADFAKDLAGRAQYDETLSPAGERAALERAAWLVEREFDAEVVVQSAEAADESPRTAADLFGDSDDEESAVFESTDDDQSEFAERSDDVETVETDGDADPLSDALDEE